MPDSDHDLLVALHEQIKQVRTDIANLQETNDTFKVDHEQRIRTLEAFKSVIFGGLILSNAIIVPIIVWLTIRALSGHTPQ